MTVSRSPNSPKKYSDLYPPSVQDKGFCMVPNCLLLCYSHMGLTRAEKDVLTMLMVFDTEGTKEVYMSHNRLALFSGKRKTSVQTSVRSLVRKGWIKVEHNMGQSNTYRLLPIIAKLKDHDCVNPFGNMKRPYRKTERPPYQKTETIKEAPKRRTYKKEETTNLGDILKAQYAGYMPRGTP